VTRALPALLALAAGCSKVPIVDVEAGFAVADAAWFEAEETLFFFYEVSAEQGLGEPSVIELAYTTDSGGLDWTPVDALEMVHGHEPVDCGVRSICGSASLAVPEQPRDVRIRLRYHRDGALALEADTVYNVVAAGEPYDARSLVVYGVFDEANQQLQWRGRHQLPTLRNHEAEALGLRRYFAVREVEYGSATLTDDQNLYGYGVECPSYFFRADQPEVSTWERAVFSEEPLPVEAGGASVVCAEAEVTDSTGSFITGAVARKNPEVRPAYPVLRSPVDAATRLDFYLAPCDRTISEEHEAMQRQRLRIGDLPTTCIDDWDAGGFVDELTETFREAVEAARPAGDDMVLVVGLSQDESGVSEAVQEALARVVPGERGRSSPRLAGAFVFDSDDRGMSMAALGPVTLWCPASIPTDEEAVIVGLASLTCAILPDNPELELGPFSFSTLPILPSREQYLEFIDTYSVSQAGEVNALSFLAPELSVTADHVDFGEYGAVTFLDDEAISADVDDAFSYCAGDTDRFVFRSAIMESPYFAGLVSKYCADLGLDEEVCGAAALGLLPIQWLPDWHNLLFEGRYELGVYWEFPYLLRMDYEFVTAGAVSAFGLSVPFGFAEPAEAYYGAELWLEEELPLGDLLTQCDRFCDHPTFDSAGVYQVTDSFRDAYPTSCYQPLYPTPGDSGFPLDP
jgi:hypothetical protein